MHIVICMGLVWSVSVRVYAVERDPSDPRMSDEKLSGVLQQLVSAGNPLLQTPCRPLVMLYSYFISHSI